MGTASNFDHLNLDLLIFITASATATALALKMVICRSLRKAGLLLSTSLLASCCHELQIELTHSSAQIEVLVDSQVLT